MSNTERKRVLNYRNDNGLAPNPDNIDYGEIAIGYKKDNEAIYIKTTANDIVDFTPISIVNITYNKLKELRDNSKLKPSQYYRITDFVTTVANDPEAQSAGHQFDIIVLASDKNRLQEECYAIQHEGDTYFANCNLAAWKIWYCMDNDTTKYMWADTVNGKGVIYRMIDEWGNDCPYDFKNVQYKRYRVTDNSTHGELSGLDGTYIGYNGAMTGLIIENKADFIWAYTFTYKDETFNDNHEVTNIDYIDYSIYPFEGPYKDDASYLRCTKKGGCSYNIISRTYGSIGKDGQFYITAILNNIVLRNGYGASYDESDVPCEMYQNTFSSANFNITLAYGSEANHFGGNCSNIIAGLDFYANTFGGNCHSNSFGDGCSNNSFGNNCDSNSFGSNCFSNSFGDGCDSNSFGNNCDSNSFGGYCYSNSFGNDCHSNSFGDGCTNNSFGNSCTDNSFGNNCDSNSFGNNCVYNSFGDGCDSNSFDVSCDSNSFGNDCSNNTFGYDCDNNTFGNSCSRNTFGYGCGNNTFGNNCLDNTFGNECRSNSFGNDCSNNSFGSYCYDNSFGNNCRRNTFGDVFHNNALGNDIQYIEIPTEKIYHTQILNGTKGTEANKLTLEFTPETTYSQFAGFTSDGVLKIWVEADAPHDTVDGGSY